MATSFDDKVEALRRLREKRQARLAAETKTCGGYPQEDPAKVLMDSAARPLDSDATERSEMAAATAAPALAPVLKECWMVESPKDATPGDNADAKRHHGCDVESPEQQSETGQSGVDRKQVSALFAALTGAPAATTERPDPAGPGGEGEFDAIFMSAHCYERGIHGCDKDEAKAVEYYRIAAENGHDVAQWRLAELLEFGRGVEQDDDEAAKWYRKAAVAGHSHAQAGLALMLEAGRGCEQDDAEAFRWHLKAAEQDHALSQYCVACCFEEGRGTEQDNRAAGRWLEKSADAGFKPALMKLSELQQTSAPKRASSTAVGDAAAWIAQGSSGGGGMSDLTDIAARLAEQLQDLDDTEAERFIDELLTDMPELLGGYAGAEDSDDDV